MLNKESFYDKCFYVADNNDIKFFNCYMSEGCRSKD